MKNTNKTEKIGTGKIYSIQSPDSDDIYIGSTFEKYLSDRLKGHRRNYKGFLNGKQSYTSSFEILKNPNYYIELIELIPNVSKEQLHVIEGIYIKNQANCINKRKAGKPTKDEMIEWHKNYYFDNKEKIKEQQKAYEQKNKEKIKERKKAYEQKNKEKIKERHKAYYQKNKEKIKEQQKAYEQNNKEQHKEQKKQYYQKNKEIFALKYLEKKLKPE